MKKGVILVVSLIINVFGYVSGTKVAFAQIYEFGSSYTNTTGNYVLQKDPQGLTSYIQEYKNGVFQGDVSTSIFNRLNGAYEYRFMFDLGEICIEGYGCFPLGEPSLLGSTYVTVALPPGTDNDCNVPLHRYNRSGDDHFYTNDFNEIGSGLYGYHYEGIAGYLCANPAGDRKALHRYFNAQYVDHFYTTINDPASVAFYQSVGFSFESVVGYVYSDDGPSRTPLYRYYHQGMVDHFYTTYWTELGYTGLSNWSWDNIEGYILGPGVKRTVPSTLKHIGFYASGYYGFTIPPDQIIDEVALHTTMVWMNFQYSTEVLDQARSLGLKVVVDLTGVFFDNFRLRGDYLSRWNSAVPILNQYQDVIYALTPADEPFYNGVKNGLNIIQMSDQLQTVGNLMHQSFPNVRLALLFQGDNAALLGSSYFRPYFVLPQYDLLGFDYYDGTSFPISIANKLVSNTTTQKLFLVPKGFQGCGFDHNTEQQLIQRFRTAYDYAVQNPRFEALVPFIWTDFIHQGNNCTGTRNLPAFRTEIERIGREFKNR